MKIGTQTLWDVFVSLKTFCGVHSNFYLRSAFTIWEITPKEIEICCQLFTYSRSLVVTFNKCDKTIFTVQFCHLRDFMSITQKDKVEFITIFPSPERKEHERKTSSHDLWSREAQTHKFSVITVCEQQHSSKVNTWINGGAGSEKCDSISLGYRLLIASS